MDTFVQEESKVTCCVDLGLLATSLVLISSTVAHASLDEPSGINLGGTSFMDGFGRTDPGFVYQQYLQVEHYDAINDQNGHSLPAFQGADINAVTSLNQFTYVSPYHVFGGALGVDLFLPIVNLSAGFAPTSPEKLTAYSGLAFGDLTWGPFLQMPAMTIGGGVVFVQRFEFLVISPTGQSNHAVNINPSSGFWSLNAVWAITLLPTPNTEFSTRLNYVHNFQNNNPAGGAAPFRAGDAVWANFAASYKVLPALNLGLNGYYFQQIQNDTVNGETSQNSETINFSLGPGLMYQPDKHNTFFVNAYLPVIERNTTSGFHLVFRWIHEF
ncbi:MAG: transporter [Alphaproteobacteria bacterium]|nr:transporter [Alphaproteobacteria bacterium]